MYLIISTFLRYNNIFNCFNFLQVIETSQRVWEKAPPGTLSLFLSICS